jgi:hypothetical protein
VEGALLEPPNVESKVKNKALEVTVTFPNDSREESGRIWWIFDRAPDGSPNYISEMIPDDQTMEMKKAGESWTATIPLSANCQSGSIFSVTTGKPSAIIRTHTKLTFPAHTPGYP